MSYQNKYPLIVRRDKVSKWFYMWKNRYSIRLAWDTRKDGFWLEVYARMLGKKDFMKDLTEILHALEQDKKAAFTLYIAPNIWKKSDTSSHQNPESSSTM